MDMEMGCDHTVLAHQCPQWMNKSLLVLPNDCAVLACAVSTLELCTATAAYCDFWDKFCTAVLYAGAVWWNVDEKTPICFLL